MKQFTIFFLALLFVSTLFVACKNEDEEATPEPEPISFPRSFTLNGFEPSSSFYYQLQNDGLMPLPDAGPLDSLILFWMTDTYGNFLVTDLEFLSETEVRVKKLSRPHSPAIDSIFTYQQEGLKVFIPLDYLAGEPLHRDEGFENLYFCTNFFSFFYYSPINNQRDYAGGAERCETLPEDPLLAAEMIIDSLNFFEVGDTIGVNFSKVTFDLNN